jgi:hypothetical protein
LLPGTEKKREGEALMGELLTVKKILQMKAGPEIDILIAKHIYKRHVILVDDPVFGITAYLYDPEAKKDGCTTTANLVGGHWVKSKTINGDDVEFFGRLVPRWSKDISWAWDIRRWLIENAIGVSLLSCCDENPECCKIHRPKLGEIEVLTQSMPESICKAALIVATGEADA